MKKRHLLKFIPVLAMVINVSCTSSQKPVAGATGTSPQTQAQGYNNDDIQEIRFESTGRGYQKKVVFTPDSIFVVIRSMTIPDPKLKEKLKPEEWQQLTQSLSGIPLGDIPDLKSPTMGRASDAAMGSAITIFTGNKQYAHLFDGTNPNEKLQKLMNTITAIEKSRTNQ